VKNKSELFVCKHLAAALESVIDPDAQEPGEDIDKDAAIPGLTQAHFVNVGRIAHFDPVLARSDIDEELFNFGRVIKGSYGEMYELSATGNIVNQNELHVYCSCPHFERVPYTEDFPKHVCKHLAAALESVLHPEYVE